MSSATFLHPIMTQPGVGRDADYRRRMGEYYVKCYRDPSRSSWLSPSQRAFAEAQIEADRLFLDINVSRFSPDHIDPVKEKEAFDKAMATLNDGYPTRGPMWGVRKSQLPGRHCAGQLVTVYYSNLGDVASLKGFVVRHFEWKHARAAIIRVMETRNGLSLEGGWRFAILWMPNFGAQAGFL